MTEIVKRGVLECLKENPLKSVTSIAKSNIVICSKNWNEKNKYMEQEDENSSVSCTLEVQMENDHKMNKRPEFDESEISKNPFTYELAIPVTEIIKDVEFLQNAAGVLVNKVLYAEKTKKVELYIHESSRDNIANLSDKAQRLYLHILYTLKRSKDWVFINKEFYMAKNKVKSNTTYTGAIKEMERYQFILKTHIKGIWWINPHRFFPGSKVAKYSNNIKVVGKWDQRDDQED